MIFGMTPFTFVHVVLSLIGILAGFIALIRLAHFQIASRLECTFSHHHGAYQHHGFLVSLSQVLALSCVWDYFPGGTRARRPCAVCLSPRRLVAPHLRHHRGYRTVPECFRPDCAALRKSASPQGACPHAKRTALPRFTTGGSDPFYCHWHAGHQALSARRCSRRLIRIEPISGELIAGEGNATSLAIIQ